MTESETLKTRMVIAMDAAFACGLVPEEIEHFADAALAALGLDDLDAAVSRVEYRIAMALHQRAEANERQRLGAQRVSAPTVRDMAVATTAAVFSGSATGAE